MLIAAAATGCGGDDGEDEFRTFFAAEPYGQAACNERDALLSGRRELRLFRAAGENLEEVTRGLQRYYRRHGLTFFTRSQPATVTLEYALDTDNAGLERALAETFPGVDLSDEAKVMATDPVLYDQVITFVLNYMFKPVTAFARANLAGPAVTNVVLLRQLERPGGEKVFGPGASLAGLAISPPLLQVFTSSGLPEGQIWDGIDLPADFTPMVFLDGKVLSQVGRFAPVLRDLVVAHEFGHTASLVHREEVNNLMFPAVAVGVSTCADSLASDQLTAMRASLGFSPVVQARVISGDGSSPAPSVAKRRASEWFAPKRFVAMLHGDREAKRELLAPFVNGH
jgi:hypothetical protein